MSQTINAGEALTGSGIAVEEVRERLTRVEPYAVQIRSARPWFRRLWAPGIAAVATPWGVYVTDSVYERIRSGAEPQRDGTLVVHELTHLEQFRRLGPVRHLTHYAADYLKARIAGSKHWDAYRGIRLEVEAREVAAEFDPRQGPR